MKYDTTRFGMIEAKDEDIIIFPNGPLGFPDCTRFIFIDEDKAAPFRMLQSLDNLALAFVVLDPLLIRPNYEFKVSLEDLKILKVDSTVGLNCYCIVTMASNIANVSVNLQGPLVINTKMKLAHQFVLMDSDYTTREKLLFSAE